MVNEYLKHQAPNVNQFVDAVGAGDGFSAVTLLGIIHQWQAEHILSRSLEFAAEICQNPGAIIKDRGIYENKRMAWRC